MKYPKESLPKNQPKNIADKNGFFFKQTKLLKK
jgi:hypothetical protein